MLFHCIVFIRKQLEISKKVVRLQWIIVKLELKDLKPKKYGTERVRIKLNIYLWQVLQATWQKNTPKINTFQISCTNWLENLQDIVSFIKRRIYFKKKNKTRIEKRKISGASKIRTVRTVVKVETDNEIDRRYYKCTIQ